MADSAGTASAPSAPSGQSATPSTPPSGFESAGSDNSHLHEQPKADRSSFANSEREKPEKSAKPKADAKPVESDDDELEVFGEKMKRKDWRELQDIKKRRAEFDRAAHTRMQEAAEQRKQVAAEKAEILRLANALKEDPWALHRGQGMSDDQLNELAEQRLVAQMKRAQMTPEQIEHEALKAELASLKGEKEKTEKTAKEQRQAELKDKWVKEYDRQIGEAMGKANLARTRETARKVASVIAKYQAIGESIDPYLAARIVKEDNQTEISHELTELATANPRAAIAMIPDAVKALIRQDGIAEAKQFQPQKQKQEQTQPKPAGRVEPLTFEEARKKLGIRGY